MYKNFILATIIAFTPPSHKVLDNDFIANFTNDIHLDKFTFKSSFPSCLLNQPQKKDDAWSPNWMAAAQENIRKSEYQFKWEERYKAYCTPNRKNKCRLY